MDLEPPEYIDTAAALESWVGELRGSQIIAVDTESDSFHHYQEKVCLIQMTANGRDVLIDPLAIGDLGVLAPVFSDPNRIKIFHDAGYDLVCLSRDFNFDFRGLFDTMLASRLLGVQRFGLAAVLKEHFDFEADKSQQRSDWARRPLSDKQIKYARYDTHFLPRLADALGQRLVDCDRLGWAKEDFERLPKIAASVASRSPANDPEGFWRIQGLKAQSPDVIGRVRALYLIRDKMARRIDRPPFKVFSNKLILELAQEPPKTLEELGPRPGLRRAGVDRFGPEILKALASAEPFTGKAPRSSKRRRSGRFMDPIARGRYEALRELRKSVASDYSLDPEVMLSNACLEDLAQKPPESPKEVGEREDLAGWRTPIFSEPIYKCLESFDASQKS